MKTRRFQYGGDDENKSRMVSWLQGHLKAIATCVAAELPEASLALIYAGIDTFGMLAAPAGSGTTNRTTFMDWCDKYIIPRLQSIEGETIGAVDLYGARCGVLHTSTPVSDLGRAGKAHEIWYQFKGTQGFNLMAVMPSEPFIIDVEALAIAFKDGSVACLKDLNQDPVQLQAANGRAEQFLRWGVAI